MNYELTPMFQNNLTMDFFSLITSKSIPTKQLIAQNPDCNLSTTIANDHKS